MHPVAERVLKALKYCDTSVNDMARQLDVPNASVRRSIQELRANGYTVTCIEPACIYHLESVEAK